MSILLTIGITAYNRPKELKRCIESINTKYTDLIEIIVSEDKSPKREEIENVLNNIQEKINNILVNFNENNLGYDRNLKKLIDLASGKYILFLSDDDELIPGALNNIIDSLRNFDYGVIYSPFYEEEIKKYSRSYKRSYIIPKGEIYLKKHIYDSILFSGLIFNTSLMKKLDAEKFLNKNYFQVYMFLYGIHFYGGFYSKDPLVNCVGDGENGYGLSDSSEKNELLADRTSFLSNLQFHKGLISVIKMFDNDFNTNYYKYFEKEYNIRTATGFSKAAQLGKKEVKQYWDKLNTLDINISFCTKFYYFIFKFLPYKIVTNCLFLPRKFLLTIRGRN